MDPARRYLLGKAIAAANTAYALRPARTSGYPAAASLAVAWATTELPLQCLAVQAATTGLAVRRGALQSVSGRVGTALSLMSLAGLVELERRARLASRTLEVSLEAGLGRDHRTRVAFGAEEHQTARPRSALLRTLRAHRRFARHRDIAYGPHGTSNLLDVWRAPGPAPRSPAPVLLHVPGGGYVVGHKQGLAYPLMSHLVERGWLCVSMSYRPAPEASWPAPIVDVKRALAWIRAHIADYGGDPGFIAVTGGSAGAQLAALAGVTACDPAFQPGFEDADTTVQAVVPSYGIYDWTPPEVWPAMQAYLLRHGFLSSSYERAPGLYEQASPARRISTRPPPFFVLHGEHDVFAPASGARRFAALLRQAGGVVVHAELPGAQHAFDVLGSPRAAASAVAVARFLEVVHQDWATA